MKEKLIKFIEKNHNESDEVPENDASMKDIINFTIVTDSNDKYQDDFKTPLLSALIRKNKFELALELAATSGVKLSANDSNGKTPLDYAKEKHNEELITALSGTVSDSDSE
jgi:hypothetical protein